MRGIKLCLIPLIAVLLFSGCPKTIKIFPTDDFTKEAKSKYEATLAEMERNRRLWRESKIENYNFETEIHAGSWQSTFPPAAIRVRDGKLVSMEKLTNDNPTDFSDFQKRATTIENLFDLIRQELNNGRIIEAKYHQDFGFPQRIRIIDSSKIDDHSLFEIKNFEFITQNFYEEWKGNYEKTLFEINKNRLLWQENKISNYDFVCEQFRGGMYGYPRVVVKVRDGKPFSLEGTENLDLTMNKIDDYDKMGSFENMFDFLQAELEKGRILTVKYNKLGYPQVVDILYFYGIHGSKRVQVSKFEIIK
jgi:hypothetical protein